MRPSVPLARPAAPATPEPHAGAGDEGALRLLLIGRVGHPAFPPWIERRRRRLGLRGGIEGVAPGRVAVAVQGAPDMIDAFELACLLGPAEVWVEEARRESLGASSGDPA